MAPCELCERDVPRLTVHHLIPKSQGNQSRGRRGQTLPTAHLCPACHRQLHALYCHERLARELNNVSRLRDEPEMARFLKWVRKQAPGKGVRVRR